MIENCHTVSNVFFYFKKKEFVLSATEKQMVKLVRGPDLSVPQKGDQDDHTYLSFPPHFSRVASIRSSTQNAGKHSLPSDDWNNSIDISKLLFTTMAVCRSIKTFLLSLICGVVCFFFYVGIIALITYKERGGLISSTHSKIHTELRTTH